MPYRSVYPLFSLLGALLLCACSQQLFRPPVAEAPRVSRDSESARLLRTLPPPKASVVVSVYDFQDQTGQLKHNDNFADYSRAVTQGGLALLNKALLQAGDGKWFTVVERGGLKDLIQERQIVRMMRDQYPAPDGQKLGNLPPLLYAGMLIEGGVVGYDSNIVTGGIGANYLGVGADVQYRRDIVTVELRAVSIATGQILLSATSEKTIYSTSVTGNVFKYVSLDHLLQMDTGYAVNEPTQLAVRQAIETAVYSLIMEGTRKGVLQFANEQAGRAALNDYLVRMGDPSQTAETRPALPSAVGLHQPLTPAANANLGHETVVEGKSEKRTIFGGITDFLSFGDENNHTSEAPPLPEYPPVPLPPRTSHRAITPDARFCLPVGA